MSKFKTLSILLSFCAVLYFSCKKDNDDDSGGCGNHPPSSDLWGAGISININGRVLDFNGNVVSGAQVMAGSNSTTTDAMGVFRLSGVSAYQKLGYVKVEKTGFFPGSRSFVPGSGGDLVEIRLLPKAVAGTVAGNTGGTAVGQGVSVILAPNSVVKSDNSVHTGTVKVSIANIDPTGANFNQEMPGNLLAVQNDQPRGLTSFGMVAVELSSGSGLPLQLAQGQTATVKFPIAPALQSSAPSSIDLWSFDENNGYWKHEGQATRSGNEYIAQVSHFSFWNCDIPWDNILLDGLVKNTNNQPVPNATVTVTSNNLGSASDITNGQGSFGGYVPANAALSISVSIDCGGTANTVYVANIGPFASNTTLSPIVINSQGITTVTGTVVDCNNTTLANSYVVANGQVYYAPNGQFSFQACGSTVSITPCGTSPWVAGNVQNLSLSGGTVSAGSLQACATGVGAGSCVGGPSTVTDIDGNVYNVFTIGNQCWMQENLKVSKYRNGDLIPTNLDNFQWYNATSGAFTVYDNDSNNNAIFGKLYNWYAVADPRGLCPTGWHVPSDFEWTNLTNILGGDLWAGGSMKAMGDLQSGTGLWESPNTGATNSSGFTALPGGRRHHSSEYLKIGFRSFWWTSTHFLGNLALGRNVDYDSSRINGYYGYKTSGFSVRCVRD